MPCNRRHCVFDLSSIDSKVTVKEGRSSNLHYIIRRGYCNRVAGEEWDDDPILKLAIPCLSMLAPCHMVKNPIVRDIVVGKVSC